MKLLGWETPRYPCGSVSGEARSLASTLFNLANIAEINMDQKELNSSYKNHPMFQFSPIIIGSNPVKKRLRNQLKA